MTTQSSEIAAVKKLFLYAFVTRMLLALFFHLTDLDRTLRLTKDGFLYTRVGEAIADYWRTNGQVQWPARVSSITDHLYEYSIGFVFLLTDNSTLAVRFLGVLSGAFICVVVWRTARYLTNPDAAYLAAVGAAFFPTQLYYSTLTVRDSQSTLAITLVFLGIVAVTVGGKTRDMVALPIGMLLVAGYRSYVFTALVPLIALAWILTSIIAKSRQRSGVLTRTLLIGIVLVALGSAIGIEQVFTVGKSSQITDIDYWNMIRDRLNKGSGAMYAGGDIPELGTSIVSTVGSFIVGFYFFFMSVNPTELNSIRQLMALPEMLLVIYIIPSMIRGIKRIWRHHRHQMFPVLFVAAAITFAYSGVTTNAGPLMRWRLQVVNVYIIVAAIGFRKTYVPEPLGLEDSCNGSISRQQDKGLSAPTNPEPTR